jgi:lambda family phage portal protein
VEQWNPQHPNSAFGVFCESILRCIARGAGVTYMTLTGDLSSANYSSLRAGQAPERDAWRVLHQWMIPRLHDRVYRAWLPLALLAGRIAVDSRLSANYTAVTWKGRGWVSVDPLKDIQAWERKIRLGVGSRTKMLSEEGDDYEATIDELREESDYASQEGVDISGVDAAQPITDGATDSDSAPLPAASHRRLPLRVVRGVAAGA